VNKLWRCLNEECVEDGGKPGYDFEAAAPVCPKCGADGRKNTQAVSERARLHYLVSSPDGAIVTPNGNRYVACDPAAKRLPKYATGYHGAVTCPECLASEVVKAHAAGEVVQHKRIITSLPDSVGGV